jgi:hypothetical protein
VELLVFGFTIRKKSQNSKLLRGKKNNFLGFKIYHLKYINWATNKNINKSQQMFRKCFELDKVIMDKSCILVEIKNK